MSKAVLVEERVSVTLVDRENDSGAETQRAVSGKQRKNHIKDMDGVGKKGSHWEMTECPCLFSAGLLKARWLILCT